MPRLAPLHSGSHDSVGDFTASDWLLGLGLLAVLAGLGVLLWRLARRRRGDGP